MKDKIHPNYGLVLVTCASCGNEFVVRSTKLNGPKREYNGQELPTMTLEICSQCHPFFSGKQIYVDTAGRVEKFQRRYGSFMETAREAENGGEKKADSPSSDKPAGESEEASAKK